MDPKKDILSFFYFWIPGQARNDEGQYVIPVPVYLFIFVVNSGASIPIYLTDENDDFRGHTRTGRPLGSRVFVIQLEDTLGRRLRPRKPGRKPKPANN